MKPKKDEKPIGTEWVKYDVIELPNQWAYVIGIKRNCQTGETFMVLAKGPLKEKQDKKEPIYQINWLKVKSNMEWKELKKLGDKYAKKRWGNKK